MAQTLPFPERIGRSRGVFSFFFFFNVTLLTTLKQMEHFEKRRLFVSQSVGNFKVMEKKCRNLKKRYCEILGGYQFYWCLQTGFVSWRPSITFCHMWQIKVFFFSKATLDFLQPLWWHLERSNKTLWTENDKIKCCVWNPAACEDSRSDWMRAGQSAGPWSALIGPLKPD